MSEIRCRDSGLGPMPFCEKLELTKNWIIGFAGTSPGAPGDTVSWDHMSSFVGWSLVMCSLHPHTHTRARVRALQSRGLFGRRSVPIVVPCQNIARGQEWHHGQIALRPYHPPHQQDNLIHLPNLALPELYYHSSIISQSISANLQLHIYEGRTSFHIVVSFGYPRTIGLSKSRRLPTTRCGFTALWRYGTASHAHQRTANLSVDSSTRCSPDWFFFLPSRPGKCNQAWMKLTLFEACAICRRDEKAKGFGRCDA